MSRTRIYCFLIIVIVGIIKGTSGSYESSGNINYHGFNQTNKVMNNLNLIDRSNEDMHLTPRQLIRKYGYRGETHRVTTEDGYVLEMHRITGPKSNSNPAGKPVVFLMHGIVSSSVDWIIIGPQSGLAYLLADQGYDVWMGNARGNKYSRKHKRYSVLNKEYWQFSWHEIGIYDLPAMIDYILAETKSKSLTYAGHSQGTTAFWVLASTKPQYNKKIDAMFALAPIAYVANVKSPLFRALLPFDSLITGAMEMLGSYEFQPTEEFTKRIKGFVCDPSAWSQPVCENIILIMAGLGTDQVNKTHLPIILGHVPAGAAVKQFIHYAQLIKSGQFRQFDYGFFGNIKKYGKSKPPAYDLSKITTPVVLHYCLNDYLAHVTDVDKLTKRLPNIHARLRVQHDTFSHLDYVWGVDVKDLVYKKMFSFMNNFQTKNN